MKPKETKTLAILSALIIIAAVTASQGEPNKNSKAAEQAVLARLSEIQAAAERLDAEKVFTFVLENDAGMLAQNGLLFLTRKEALESTKAGFQNLQKLEYRFDQQHVTLLSPTIALATGEGTASATRRDSQTINTRFAQSVLLLLTNGEWKVFHAHRSFPPAK